MDSASCLFWFSGTGNSLYAAKQLSANLGDLPLVKMADEVPIGAVGGEGAKVGFVFPSYYCNLPRVVRSFIEKLEIKPGTYIFAVVTMGGLGGGTISSLEAVLKSKGLRLNYARGLSMPGNYVILYNPAAPDKSKAATDKADERLKKFAGEITARKQTVKKFPYIGNKLYKDIEQLDAAFTVRDVCTGCGMCEKICPVHNIRLENQRPKWLHHCEHCVACISWCPVKAIEYGERTRSRRRYRNLRISADELMRQE